MNRQQEICNAFNQHAADYEQAAKVQHEIGLRMFERLDYLKINPRYILDLGCGPGYFSHQLKKRYPDAQIIAVDLAFAMLAKAAKKQRLWRKWPLVNGNMMTLPFANGVFDLVFANQVIHWADSLGDLFRELNRVMNTDGCLMFSTLGPDTFKELRQAWQGVHQYSHTNQFADMHDIGDFLMAERFGDPVVDMEHLTVHYPSPQHIVNNLKQQGVRNINPQRCTGLTGKQAWTTFKANYEQYRTESGKYPLTYEVVYGHAWKGAQQQTSQGVETFIPVSAIKVKP
ncbi:malonyl-ACP O-methyltransferase BioC [Legionella dresdenensis]|uniref:Malonyl-[acyl-carrier protein] O-methyltransferase n=1 Tax=Legionella dresdenensis TaxID=450200 RepID=A0ABV8CGS0_9GAMM